MNKSFFAVDTDGMIIRYDPQVVVNPNEAIARMANKEFQTIKNFDVFRIATGCNRRESLIESDCNFHLSMTPAKQSVFWTFLPGIPFYGKFRVFQNQNVSRLWMTPDNQNYQESIDVVEDRLWWPSSMSEQCPKSKANGAAVFRIRVIFCSVISKTPNPKCETYLLFNLKSMKDLSLSGNYLPPIPNIYPDGRICMGHDFNSNFKENKSTHEVVQESINSFFRTRMNSHLMNDSMDRQLFSTQLFNWSDEFEPQPPISSIDKILTRKVGNYYFDGLPLFEKDFESAISVI